MIIVMKQGAAKADVDRVEERIRALELTPTLSRGQERMVIGVIGDEDRIRDMPLDVLPGVEQVMRVVKPYRLASLMARPERSTVTVPAPGPGGKPVIFGADRLVVIAGPCSVEGRDMLYEIARATQKAGATVLRGGAFKPRSSPYAFQGLGVEGLRYLAEVRRELGIPVMTEVMDTRDVELVADVADIVQVGARNMQNFNLLKVIGCCRKPVLLKRGLSNTLEELLMSAEYIMSQGNSDVLLCERGIRTFEPATRNTLDLSAVPVLRKETHLPVVVDPSHGTGHWDLVVPMARAAVAAGADSIVVEVHPKPDEAKSDGSQSLLPETFEHMMSQLKPIAAAVGRSI